MYLILSILSSTLINLVFRYFPRYQVDNQQAIAVNYLTCVVTGLITSGISFNNITANYSTSWGPYTLVLGLLFVTVFFGMAVTAQKFGISVSVIAAKMGVIFPVMYAFVFLNEAPTVLLIVGIVLSLVSVFFVSKKDKSSQSLQNTWVMLLPLFVLLGSGVIDTSLKVIEQQIVGQSPAAATIMIFMAASVLGVCITLYRVASKKTVITRQNIIGGIVLGIPNYFSIFFLLKALQSDFFKTSQVYPLNNIGIVVASTVLSVIIFKEHLNKRNIFGIIAALLAIVLISMP